MDEQKNKVEKIISGKAKPKKKSELKKFADVFLSEDISSVRSYIWYDVLVPAIKKAIDDVFTNGVKTLLWGSGSNKKNSSYSERYSYRSCYDKSDERRPRYGDRNRGGYSYDDIVLESRSDAEDVLSKMDEIISVYEMVSVADLYDLVGIVGSHTDVKYGWTNISNASVVRVRDGYWLKLPKAIPLD